MSGFPDEDAMVETNSVESPLRRISRLTAPRRDAFGPSGAEISALALLNQQGGPQMLGYLAGLNADRLRAQDAFEQNLAEVNAQQSDLARMSDRTARRDQDFSLVRTALNTPNAASAFPSVMAMASPDGQSVLRAFSETTLDGRRADAGLTRARTVDALRGPSAAAPVGERTLTPPQLLALRDRVERAGDAAMREVLVTSRQPNTFTLVNGQAMALPGTAPLTPEQVAAANAARDAARARVRAELSGNPTFRSALEQFYPTQQNAPAPVPAAAPAPAPQPTPQAAQPPAPQVSGLAARVNTARGLGWQDDRIRAQLLREGRSAEEVDAALRAPRQ